MVSMVQEWLRDLRYNKTGAPTVHVLAFVMAAGLLVLFVKALSD